MDSFIVTLNIAQLNVDVQHIYILGQIDTGVWNDHLGPIPSQTLIKSKKNSVRLLVLSAAITNLWTVAVFYECSRMLNCHFYKREGSNSE